MTLYTALLINDLEVKMINLANTTVIYGQTGVAKSSFVINYSILNNCNTAVVFLTSEMSPRDIIERSAIITNEITAELYKNATNDNKIGFNNINNTRISHITILNNREAAVSLDQIADEIQKSKASGIERVILVIDSYNMWADSIKQSDEDIINKLMELQDSTGAEYVLVCQEHRLSNSVKHFADLILKFSYEKNGKSINGKKLLKITSEKNRHGDCGNTMVEFSGSEQKFYF